jgi:hypothetical protein
MDDNRSDCCHTSDSTGSAYSTGWLYDRQVCLANKIALVTGAASGIGKAVVTELVQRKAFVFAADIDGDRVRDLASQLNNTTALTHGGYECDRNGCQNSCTADVENISVVPMSAAENLNVFRASVQGPTMRLAGLYVIVKLP